MGANVLLDGADEQSGDSGSAVADVRDRTERPAVGTNAFTNSGGGGGRSTDDSGAADREHLSTDDIFVALSNQRRRYVVEYLRTHEGTATLRDLSRQIASWENGIAPEQLQRKDRKRVYTALHQTHLPKMHKLGLVTYDSNRGTVALTPRVADLEPYLDGGVTRPLHVERGAFGLSMATSALVALTWAGVLPQAASPFAYAFVVAGLFLVAAGVQLRTSRRSTPAR